MAKNARLLEQHAAMDARFEMKVYPNPAADFVHIRFEKQAQQQAAYSLLEVAGRSIGEGKLLTQEVNTIKLDHLPEGAYFIRVELGGRLSTRPVVKVD